MMDTKTAIMLAGALVLVFSGRVYRSIKKPSGRDRPRKVGKFAGAINARFAAMVAAEKASFENGTRAVATFTRIRPTGSTVNNVNVSTVLVLRVDPPNGAPYEVSQTRLLMESTMPRIGQKIQVGIDPGNPQHVTLESDWTTDTPGGLLLKAYDDPTTASPAAAPPAQNTRLDALTALGQRHSAGELSDEQFAAAKAQILNSG